MVLQVSLLSGFPNFLLTCCKQIYMNKYRKMKGKNTKHTSVDYYNTLFVLFNIIPTRKKINDHKSLVCDKEKFALTIEPMLEI